jgi:hypothetical protein
MANTVLATGYPKMARAGEDAFGTRHRSFTYDFLPASTYGTGGGILVSPSIFGVSLQEQIENVILADWSSGGPSGYVFFWNHATGAIQFFVSGGFTPAGTISAPTITTTTNASTSAPVYVTGGALTQIAGATGIAGVQAPTFTGSAVSAGVLVEVGNVSVSSVTVRGTFWIKP